MDKERTLTTLDLSGTDIVIASKNHVVLQASKGHHIHPVPELHVCLSGAGTLVTSDESVDLRRGDCVLIGPNAAHHFEVEKNTSMARLEATLHIDRHAVLPDGYRWLWQENTVKIWKPEEPFFSLAQLIASETLNRDFDYENVISNSYYLLFTLLARMSGDASGVRAAAAEKWDKSAKARYTRDSIDSFLLLNYGSDITLSDLAGYIHVSARHAHRLVIKHTGQTFKQYLVYIRMSNAKHLLQTTNLPVYEIAEKVGYNYSGNFCKAFYQNTCMTPKDYREWIRQLDV